MANLNLMLQELQTIAANPRTMLDKYLAEGKKVVGCFPIYSGEELVHAAGMIPMGIWGGQVNPSAAGQYVPIFICSIMRSCLEYGMQGKYKGISAVVMPILCDTFRGMSGAWRVGVTDVPLIGLIQPQNREVEGARDFLAAEYAAVKNKLPQLRVDRSKTLLSPPVLKCTMRIARSCVNLPKWPMTIWISSRQKFAMQ